ncbi:MULTISPECIES: hypothetical protein [unclassified Paraburkholderia]|uniref:hypothetical protein n=1 Tax=unclassified Paraburkholderia TaxID=2615204 RepID=UPI001617FCE6|nr:MULTISPECIES: hypothetical protein [unclassified Paraburkholderia]MBB5443262.1 uncharacterized membrane protein YidH (DUF202 family) [Paraburkholderia sp. WSM4177]MBB5483132.1 uncharacterized membrane protein YidH (DUF202 family) [Paraburkholderia sp. WSM4180]
MNSTFTFLGVWTLIALVCSGLWAFVRSDRAVRRLDMLERSHPVWTWLAMILLLVSAALALVYINTDVAPQLTNDITARGSA